MKKAIFIGSALGRNVIPIGAFLFGGNSAETALVIYFLETLIAILLAAVFVRLRAPAEDSGYGKISSTKTVIKTNNSVIRRYQAGNRRSMLESFLLFSIAFALVPGIFIGVFLFGIQRAEISISVVASAIAGIAAFQIISFIVDLFRVDSVTPESAYASLEQSMGRSAILFLSCFIGIFLAAFVTEWFIVPFAFLKTVTEVGAIVKRD
ncbi:MAG TPA: DUF6498-containing protein [Anaerolineales bacterium]|nr:DUF6498-containing protein [Anaerolineales bacterium]